MNTIKLYQQDVYQRECEAAVAGVEQDTVLLDRTVFFPTGGGQSCDLGTIDGLEVTEVYEKDDLVYHRLASPAPFKEGQQVHCRIDWERRFDNMQRHCGEHILSGICYQLFGGVNRGFHMGQDYMTIDISLEENPQIKEVTWEMAKQAELAANEVVWSDAPVTVRRFETREEAEKMPLRKALAIDEEISIVCVGDEKNAADCVACCGTHPAWAGQVGIIKLYKVEHYKGMFRIYFEAGKRALMDYDQKHDLITALGNRYSAGVDDLMDKIKSREEKTKAVKNELHVLRQSVIQERIEAIRSDLASAESGDAPGREGIFIYEYDDMKTDDLLNIGRPLIGEIPKLLLIVSPQDNTLLLFSDGGIDCGKLVKENASIYNGKGGGNASSARAIFPKRDGLDTFIDLLEKHLR
ncbi:alanine--tRNA ligase-related protein [Anaerovorax odorimutans]|uniref:Alanine--tRNA ligase-related protein n=1 Tax=Anaerovorax odorimutans TaxID=109327 RepID=A0ABT1RQY5_9FIRM|nr:alanine--tRNA ligase-related protein [Anaerovorax odorimutans]MCQ4637569.1 alanine--tRNA ligase-related protein [Anaerovorax odorimutans]